MASQFGLRPVARIGERVEEEVGQALERADAGERLRVVHERLDDLLARGKRRLDDALGGESSSSCRRPSSCSSGTSPPADCCSISAGICRSDAPRAQKPVGSSSRSTGAATLARRLQRGALHLGQDDGHGHCCDSSW